MSVRDRLVRFFVKRKIKQELKRRGIGRQERQVVMELVTKILAYVFKLKVVPSGYLTVGSGVVGMLMGLLCMAGVSVPGVDCPADPLVLLTAGAGLVGLGRRQ